MKSLSRVRLCLCATPWTAAYQAPPSVGFSRQEYWSGVPLPSPFNMQCEKNKMHTTQSMYVLRCPVTSDSSQPQGLQPARLLGPWDFPGKNTGMGWHFLLQGIFPTQGSNPQFLCLLHWQVDSLPMCHLGSPVVKGEYMQSSTYIYRRFLLVLRSSHHHEGF